MAAPVSKFVKKKIISNKFITRVALDPSDYISDMKRKLSVLRRRLEKQGAGRNLEDKFDFIKRAF